MDVEWLILADAAEVVNNKLYLIGGGWQALTVNVPFPVRHPCALAAAFRVRWDETDRQHDVELEVVDREGRGLATVSGQIEVGRPAGVPVGDAQRVQMAINLTLPLAWPGTYGVIARIGGHEVRRVEFEVVPGPEAAVARALDVL
jgi:hypothetical protein